ncbi:MAG: FdhF/YdeP family oxidoreductase, partial [Pirellulaceae bacterium]|nr:FdhF/YdeP family oxidoreductase [Pirellulaceae bacterium]
RQAGGFLKMFRALRSRNACKTCALGMGGQRGGMVNETGGFPEVCKKSLQAMAADMQGAIREDFWRKNSLAALKKMTPRELEMSGRLVHPLLYEAGSKHLRPIDWEQAISRVASRLQGLQPDQTFWYFSGRSSNEAGFSLQLLARLYGTNNVNNCSYYCHQASGVGLSSAIGSGTATVVLEDLEHADLVFLIGGNPPSNHPRLMTSLMRVKRRGGKLIVINPVVETGLVKFKIPSNVRSMLLGTRMADLYVQPHIGGDLALLTGIAKEIDQRGASDRQFLEDHCDGVETWLESIRSTSWEDIQDRSGVCREEIVQIADLYQQSEKTIMGWTMGITHHQHGVQNVQAIANLALMRGMVGRPHAGLMPIRGHSNVQGIGSVGVTPRLKDAFFSALEDHYQVQLPTSEGKDTLACIEAAHRGELKMGFCLGGNLYGSNPDSVFAAEAMQQLDGLVHLSTTLNTGHLHALAGETIILPVLARDEEPQPTTQESMFNYVRLSDGGPRRHVGPRGEVEVIAEIASRVLGEQGPVDWASMKNTSSIRHAIGQVVPGFEAIRTIDQSRKEFQIGGRTFHQPRFATDNGRARLHCHVLPELKGAENELRLMTVRSEGQFNTVVYEEEDYYRGQDRRDVILVHPDDLARLGLQHDQLVRVQSETGQLDQIC